MIKDEALKLALEALESGVKTTANRISWMEYDSELIEKAITAIKEALAQPEQEPVATDWERIARVQNAKLMAVCDEAGGFEKLCEVMDKYEATTPPQRKPLTDAQIDTILIGLMRQHKSGAVTIARAIEAARSEERRVGKECRSRWSPYH